MCATAAAVFFFCVCLVTSSFPSSFNPSRNFHINVAWSLLLGERQVERFYFSMLYPLAQIHFWANATLTWWSWKLDVNTVDAKGIELNSNWKINRFFCLFIIAYALVLPGDFHIYTYIYNMSIVFLLFCSRVKSFELWVTARIQAHAWYYKKCYSNFSITRKFLTPIPHFFCAHSLVGLF